MRHWILLSALPAVWLAAGPAAAQEDPVVSLVGLPFFSGNAFLFFRDPDPLTPDTSFLDDETCQEAVCSSRASLSESYRSQHMSASASTVGSGNSSITFDPEAGVFAVLTADGTSNASASAALLEDGRGLQTGSSNANGSAEFSVRFSTTAPVLLEVSASLGASGQGQATVSVRAGGATVFEGTLDPAQGISTPPVPFSAEVPAGSIQVSIEARSEARDCATPSGITPCPTDESGGSASYSLTLELSAAATTPVGWSDASGGDWNDSENWLDGEVPDARAEVSVPGTYTVAGSPLAPLVSLAVGSEAGTITLEPGAEPFETKQLGVVGDVRLRSGVLEAGFADLASAAAAAVSIGDGGRLTIGGGGLLRAGHDVVLPELVGEDFPEGGGVALDGAESTLRVADLGVAVAQDVGGIGLGQTLEVEGDALLATRVLELGFEPGATAELSVTGGAELHVGDALLLATGAGSSVTGLVAGAGSSILGLRGDLLDTGPLETVIGGRGAADLVVDGADLLLGRRLVLGEEAGSSGLLTVRNGGALYASPTEVTDLTIGSAGAGELRIESGGFLGFLGPASGGPLPDLTLGLTTGGSGLFDLAGDGDPATVTVFENALVGLGGTGTWLLHDAAQVSVATLELASGSRTEPAYVDVAGADTELRVADGGGTRIGTGGDAVLEVRDGALFASGRVGPGAPLEAAGTSVGSGQIGHASTLLVHQNGTAELDALSIGEDSGQPTLTALPLDHAGEVRLASGGRLFATGSIRIGNAGRLEANVAEIESLGLELAPTEDGGAGAEVSIDTSSLRVTGTIGVGTGISATDPDPASVALRIRAGSNVLAGGLDARGPASVEIDASFARFDGPVRISAQAPVLDDGSNGDSLVAVEVRGSDGVLDASGHTVRIGGATNCLCQGALILGSGALAIADLFEVESGGILSGSDRVRGALSASAGGVVRPGSSPGTLTVEGDATFEAGSRLELEVGGTEASSQYDVLDVEGDLVFDGAVTLRFVDGFAPRRDDQFEFVRAGGALALTPEDVAIENLAPGFEFELATAPDRVTVTALTDGVYVPEPAPAAAALAALAGLALVGARSGQRRRRRASRLFRRR